VLVIKNRQVNLLLFSNQVKDNFFYRAPDINGHLFQQASDGSDFTKPPVTIDISILFLLI